MKDANKYILKLILETEVFVYLVPVPLVTYFVVIGIGDDWEKIKILLMGVGIALIPPIIIGYAWRYLRFKPLLERLFADNQDNDPIELKRTLLNYPLIEIKIVLIRWVLGGGIAHAVFMFAPNLSLREVIIIPLGVLFVIPLSMASFYFLTEKIIAEAIDSSKYKGITLKDGSFKVLDFSKRSYITILSLVFQLVGIFSFLLYYSQNGEIKLSNLSLHIIFLVLFNLICAFYTVYSTSSSTKSRIMGLYNTISQMSEGKIKTTISFTTKDEFGLIAININKLSSELSRTIRVMKELFEGLLLQSEILLKNSSKLSVETQSQSASIEQISASLHDMDSSIQSIANTSKDSWKQSQQAGVTLKKLETEIFDTVKIANASSQKANETLDHTNKGKGIVKETIQKMDDIQDSTKKVSDIIQIINDIADQVNLLSLNASIESARAGEHGRGFAVVAGEVSKLAEKTLENSKEISKFSTLVGKKVNDGKKFTAQTSMVFEEIFSKMSETTNLVKQILEKAAIQKSISNEVDSIFQISLKMSKDISVATGEQSNTNAELLQGVNSISVNTENIVQLSTGLATLSQELKEKAEMLKKDISFFEFS
ncbi:MAG: hypothetical protein H7A23_13750 [Leptospiraceae bacterium]|nr:hypothetical protein [Leptospiraceae bacterium]MCP5495613.1 hypothetical protein [Leptospiraceae bacterium]